MEANQITATTANPAARKGRKALGILGAAVVLGGGY